MATFTNQALLSYNGITTPSNIVTGEILGSLSVTKESLSETYSRGGSITYIISLINSGTTALTGLTVSDDLGSYEGENGTLVPLTFAEGAVSFFVDGILQEDPQAEVTADGLVFSDVVVPALGNAVIIYQTRVNGSAPLSAGSSITNTVTVSGAQISAPVTASSEVFTATAPSLTVTKSVTPTTVMENGTLTYDFVIENTGNVPAGEDANLVLSDDFYPILKDLTVTLDGKQLVSPADYTYDESTGEFATEAGVITVPAAEFNAAPDGTVSVTPGVARLTVSGTLV